MVGSVGDALDNAMAETTFENELNRHLGPWRDVDHVAIGTAEWVIWFNTEGQALVIPAWSLLMT